MTPPLPLPLHAPYISLHSLYDKFPLDVFLQIFAHIDVMPRIRVLSLVSKRWRVAVVKSIKIYRSPAQHQACGILTGLSQVTLPIAGLRTCLWPALRALDVTLHCQADDVSEPHCPCRVASSCSSLTRLRVYSSVNAQCMNRFIRKNACTLQSLSLEGNGTVSSDNQHIPSISSAWCEVLSSTFPNLVELVISYQETALQECLGATSFICIPNSPLLAVPFLTRHASQLQSLTLNLPELCYQAALNVLLDHTFPQLSTLHLCKSPAKFKDAYMSIWKRYPALTSIGLVDCADIDVIRAVSHALTSLTLQAAAPQPLLQAIASCKRLTSLRGLSRNFIASSSITAMMPTPSFADLPLVPSLRFLRFTPAETYQAFKRGGDLPCFATARDVQFAFDDSYRLFQVFAFAERFIDHAPALEELRCFTMRPLQETDLHIAEAFVQALHSKGHSTKVYIGGTTVSNEKFVRGWEALCHQYPWVHVVANALPRWHPDE